MYTYGTLEVVSRCILMAPKSKIKTKKHNRRKNFVAIPFFSEMALGTLGDDTVVLTSIIGSNFLEDIFCISIDLLATITDLANGEVPIVVGFAHGDLTVTEILEFLGAELVDPDNIIQRERARRPVRRTGQFSDPTGAGHLADGLKVRTTLKFSIGNDHSLSFWAVNRSGAALTTGSIIKLSGTLFGRWMR